MLRKSTHLGHFTLTLWRLKMNKIQKVNLPFNFRCFRPYMRRILNESEIVKLKGALANI